MTEERHALIENIRHFPAELEAYEYGDISFFRLAHYPIYFLSHPDYVREVLVSKGSSFEKDDLDRRILGKFLGNCPFTIQRRSGQLLGRQTSHQRF